MTAAQKWHKDARRIQKLAEAGIRVLVVWESEIRTQPQRITELIKTFIESETHIDAD